MKSVFTVALLLGAAQMVVAQDEEVKKALATCAALDIESARLDCFEQLAKAVAQVPPEPPEAPEPPKSKFRGTPGPGKWDVGVSIDPLDDTKVVVLALVDESDSLQLLLQCKQGKASAFVRGTKYLLSGSTRVATRIGGAEAETKKWRVAVQDHRAVIYPGDTKEFIKNLLSVPRLVVQVKEAAEKPITGVFKLDGLPAVVAPLRETCLLP
jgi:hypothetical protein